MPSSISNTHVMFNKEFKKKKQTLICTYMGEQGCKNNSDLCVCVCVLAGPKGVINDWRKYKQLETEQRAEQQKEMERLIKKLSMTCRSQLDDEADKQKQKELQDKINGKVRCHLLNSAAKANCFSRQTVCKMA